MYQIDNSTAAPALPTPAAPGTAGYFTVGDPATATPATIVDQDFLNSLMLEVCNVITGAGFTLSKTTYNQLYTAILALGTGIPHGSSTSSPNTYTCTLSPVLAAYTTGIVTVVKFTNANTGAATINFNALGAVPIKHLDGSALNAGDIASGMIGVLIFDGTNFQLIGLNPSNYLTIPQFQAGTPISGLDSGAANAYVLTFSPVLLSYTSYQRIWMVPAHTNTGASTLNINGLGVKNILREDGSALMAGDIKLNCPIELFYNGTSFLLMNTHINQFPFVIPGGFGSQPFSQTLPSGLIIQCGTFTTNVTPDSPIFVAFPTAFPNVVSGVFVTAVSGSSGKYAEYNSGATLAGCYIVSDLAGIGCHYLAVGY